ncbi:N-acetyl sugar amidotransferase [Gammaproteobacteria bacterium]|nr:N-acetyl sugar amidotransferase [Gammaproteobacteria bacterium]
MISNKKLDNQLIKLPNDIKFCQKCVISNQRPRIQFNKKNVCSACGYTDIKNSIDWEKREKELTDLCNEYRKSDGKYDVIVPSSGGKDSSRVAHELKYKYNMNPLTVTWAPFEYTAIGYKNFRNFIKVGGFNNLMASPNGIFHRKLARISLEAVGDPWQPFTYGQVCYAFHIAKAFDIKLVFFGENGEAEYSGDPKVFNLSGMPYELWSEQYLKGATIDSLIKYGLDETDYFSSKDFNSSDLQFYNLPDTNEMNNKGIIFRWFSYYKHWIPQDNYYYASEHVDFEANPSGRSEGTYSKYASLDDQFDGFHFYLAFIKFGIGRATADCSHEIRDGHIDREEAAVLVKKFDGEFPKKWYKEFLDYLNINEETFWESIEKFRSKNAWEYKNGKWCIKKSVWEDYQFDIEPGYMKLPDGSQEIIDKILNKK